MNDEVIRKELQQLEEELHQIRTRQDIKRMESLLHPDFEEFGRSGKRYSRTEIIDEFRHNGELPAVVAGNFQLAVLDAGTALLTYESAHQDASGSLYRYSLRSSLWLLTGSGWQMRFHQGTPAEVADGTSTWLVR